MDQLASINPKNPLQKSIAWLQNLGKFSRPHTIIGTSLSVFALYIIAVGSLQAIPDYLGYGLITWIACLCGNVYIVGLNQLEDIAIDKINKPTLPLASGEFSLGMGRAIVIFTGILALFLAFVAGIWLLLTVGVSLLIGTAYSLPPIRLKRFPFWAALCIFTVRGVIVNLGLFAHFRTVMGESPEISTPVWVLTLFILVFTIAIAIFKDVPDRSGDQKYQITTFVILVGQQTIFKLTLGIISICYIGMIAVGLVKVAGMNAPCLIFGHLALLILLWWRSFIVNLEEQTEIIRFYQFIWKLFFLEYLLFPLACLL